MDSLIYNAKKHKYDLRSYEREQEFRRRVKSLYGAAELLKLKAESLMARILEEDLKGAFSKLNEVQAEVTGLERRIRDLRRDF